MLWPTGDRRSTLASCCVCCDSVAWKHHHAIGFINFYESVHLAQTKGHLYSVSDQVLALDLEGQKQELSAQQAAEQQQFR